jgi:hypothetical protein
MSSDTFLKISVISFDLFNVIINQMNEMYKTIEKEPVQGMIDKLRERGELIKTNPSEAYRIASELFTDIEKTKELISQITDITLQDIYTYVFLENLRTIYKYRYLFDVKKEKWDKEKKRNKIEEILDKKIRKYTTIIIYKNLNKDNPNVEDDTMTFNRLNVNDNISDDKQKQKINYENIREKLVQ